MIIVFKDLMEHNPLPNFILVLMYTKNMYKTNKNSDKVNILKCLKLLSYPYISQIYA